MGSLRQISIPQDLLLPAEEFALLMVPAPESLQINIHDDNGVFANEKTLPEVIVIQRVSLQKCW